MGLSALLAAGCDSTIHKQSNIGGVDTLSIDAKQRLMLVGDRVTYDKHGFEHRKQVTCTEPSPDAIVARAAALAANANVSGTAADQQSGAGGIAGATSESAASIGYRDHTVQMLRDGYFRLCEAYMNGALSDQAYRRVVRNVDTFMVVVSALQILGVNPVAAPVAISAGQVNADATALSTSISNALANTGDGAASLTLAVKRAAENKNISAENARAAEQIIMDFLTYRARLVRAYYASQQSPHGRAHGPERDGYQNSSHMK